MYICLLILHVQTARQISMKFGIEVFATLNPGLKRQRVTPHSAANGIFKSYLVLTSNWAVTEGFNGKLASSLYVSLTELSFHCEDCVPSSK